MYRLLVFFYVFSQFSVLNSASPVLWFYFAFPWFATASIAFFTSSGSPR